MRVCMDKIAVLFTVICGLALQSWSATVEPLYFIYDDTTYVDKYDTTFVIDTTIDAENNEVYDTTGIASIDTTQVISGISSVKVDDAKQQDYWDYLMKFKLWGTNGISMGNDVSLPDSSGWSGAAHHGLTGTARDLLGGPVIVNDDIALGDQSKILKGPIRTTGNFTAGNDNGGHAFYGPVCVGGTVNDQAQRGIDRAGSTLLTGSNATTGVCAEENVPFIRSDLQIPLLPTSTYSGDVYVGSSSVGFIDVPPGAGSSDMYDLYLNSISIGNEGKLYIRMPYGGRLTRIFLKSLSFGTHPTIQVSYMGADAVFEGGQYTVTGDTVIREIQQYDGNLMFYVPHDINFQNTDNRPVQGTFISTGTITMACNMQFAGQLLANKLVLGNNIDGSGFIYVPFDPPEIDIEGLVNNIKFPENDEYVKIPVTLTKIPETNVYIEYCFYAGAAGGAANGADMDDIGPETGTALYSMPDCSLGETRKIAIPAGYIRAQKDEDDAWLYVRTDSKVEGDELLIFYVQSISGAVIKGNATNGGVFLTLVDKNNNPPVMADNTTLSVKENSSSAVVGTITATDADGETVTFSITGGTGMDLFEIDPATGEITLKSDVEIDFEKNQSFTLVVSASDGKNSVPKTFVVSVVDVNEVPLVSAQTFTATENKATGSLIGKVVKNDTDTLDAKTSTQEFVKHNIFEVTGGDTAVFTLDESGIISVKDGDLMDYEVKSVYTLDVQVRDTSVFNVAAAGDTTWPLVASTTITIVLTDVDDAPKFDTSDVKVGPADTTNLILYGDNALSTVEENNKAGVIVGAVFATCTDSTKVLVYEITQDTSGLFAIDGATGVVSVTDANVLDFERDTVYAITVKVSDGVVVADGKDANGITVQSDTRTVLIYVKDVNELPVVVAQAFEVTENEAVGTLVGTVVSSDLDSAAKYRKHTYEAVAGDTALFTIDANGNIKTKTVLDYEAAVAEGKTEFTLTVQVTDKSKGPSGETLSATETMTITLLDSNEPPSIVTDSVRVAENSEGGTEVGVLESSDPDGETSTLVYTLDIPSEFVEVSTSGEITVKDDAKIDFEQTEYTVITVTVTDKSGAMDTKTITVYFTDVNESPSIEKQEFTVKENVKVGTEVGKVKATDPDTKNADFSTLTYTLITDEDKFQVLTDGTVKVADSLDYESDSVYTLKVEVSDGTYADTATVTIHIGNVVEKSVVEITYAESGDVSKSNPDTLYVNSNDVEVWWTEDGAERKGDTTLTEGKNIIVKKFLDPSKDVPGYDTLIVYVSTATPVVTVTKTASEEVKTNIFTIEESTDVKDSSTFFVNTARNDIVVTVTDPVTKVEESFTVKLSLDTVSIPSKVFSETLSEVAEKNLPLNEDAENAIHTPINGEKIAVSYADTIGGVPVVITYYTDMKGNILEGESGKEEMTVTYTKVIDGDTVKISFQADALTGTVIESSTGAVYTVSYDYEDSKHNSVNVSYTVDEKGKLVKNSCGDVAYEVSYTYENKYGNSATQSLSIVLDTKPALVWIKSPVNDEVLNSNMAEVEWYVSVTGDTADFVLQDTLVVQGLDKGANTIVRFYVDKAGNMASDTVYIIMKDAKDVNIAIEQPVTNITADKVEEFYGDDNLPEDGQTFSVSILNPVSGAEKETQVGGSFETKDGSGEDPYPSQEGHLGPTLGIDVKVPVYSSVGGLATLDDLLGKDGLVALEGVDADNSEKMTVDEYVEEYCTADFASSLGSDYSKANLYNTYMKVKIWVFTSLGSFVDQFSFVQDLNDPDYVDDAGLLKLYFEMKPDKDGYVHTDNGRLYATGAYVYKTEVEMKSVLSCTLPPVNDPTNTQKMGSKRSTSEDLLKSFGYKRPNYKK